jgi:hypothetical protein
MEIFDVDLSGCFLWTILDENLCLRSLLMNFVGDLSARSV